MLLLVTCLLIFVPSVVLSKIACTSGNIKGTCMLTSLCSGRSVAGLCPGAANIQCCISNSGSSSSSNELCGNYIGSSINYIKGNGNVVYPVVKIRREHLTDSGIYSAGPTTHDNTMTTTTACAFDKMASAAKKSGITITINSGFRTIARQEYFWNCYKTKSCNNGNLAARPGTSNHGRGIALDLNTNCGKQTGAQPNCHASKVYQWLKNNAHKYGFKRTVQSEPWHWEYVGTNAHPSSFT